MDGEIRLHLFNFCSGRRIVTDFVLCHLYTNNLLLSLAIATCFLALGFQGSVFLCKYIYVSFYVVPYHLFVSYA